LDVVKTGLEKGPAEGFKAEAKGFGELAATKECKGLISLFHGQTECKKNPYGNPQRPAKYVHQNLQACYQGQIIDYRYDDG
jgi:enoyl-CoA hydratase/long-chain 3-hydroxyacyl-CoA dehydrogenase